VNFSGREILVTTPNPELTHFGRNLLESYPFRRALNRTGRLPSPGHAQVFAMTHALSAAASLHLAPMGAAFRGALEQAAGRCVGQPMGQIIRCLARGAGGTFLN